ncbi:MAG TPA: hypothetical protein VJ045_04315 [Hyphomicrobiaceae bacterium]|nr:hypothetical protein [Hyphomicrobiaceae bacterium]
MIDTLRELLERFVFDPSVIDLVVWYPYLTWNEFLISTVLVLSWRLVADRIERLVAYHVRRMAAFLLLRLALVIRP